MKKSVLLTFIVFILNFSFGNAQELEMVSDWNQAKELAQKENKNILVILTGSEWCSPCKKMDKNVLANPEFQEYAEKNLVIFIIDLPGGTLNIDSKIYKDYQEFGEKYEVLGLPSMTLVDKEGTKLKNIKGRVSRLKNVMKRLQKK